VDKKKRGRPKGAKSRKRKEKKQVVLICGLCRAYHKIAISARNAEKDGESSFRKIYTRMCKIAKKEVAFDTEACSKFILAKIIGCGIDSPKSHFYRTYTEACIKKLSENNDDCKKCIFRDALLQYLKENKNDTTDEKS
jgi:hypothetical protein